VSGLSLHFLSARLFRKKRNRTEIILVTPDANSQLLEFVMNEYARPETMVFVFLAVGAIALFSFLSVSSYVEARRKERDAYYKNETVRRLTESQGAGAEAAIGLLREEDRLWARRRLEGIKLGGLATMAAGIGLMIFLGVAVDDNHPLGIAIGSIPFLVGAALLVYAYRLARAPQ
jgi:hypothetical protein